MFPSFKPATQPQTLGDLFRATVGKYPHKPALFFKDDGKYRHHTWGEIRRHVDGIRTFLGKQGMVLGDRIAILSENRPEWALIDLAAQLMGLATVPIYPSLTPPEIQYILRDSAAKMLAVSNKSLLEKIPPIQKMLPDLKIILGFDASLKIHQRELSIPLCLLSECTKLSPDLHESTGGRAVQSGDLASIIYTSGTTGPPKGVMLTHDNFVQNVLRCKDTLKMSSSDVHLSFLPLCHVFERMAGHYLMIHIGASIIYAETMETVPLNILEGRPTFLLGVPRFFEKVQHRVTEKMAQGPAAKRELFDWAKGLRQKKRSGQSWTWNEFLLSPLASFLVYRQFRAGLGGRLRFCVSGGAPLAKEIAEFFYDLGVMIYEGYGLTETSPVISVNTQEKVRFGSVGVPLPGVEVKLSEEGEILTKSPCVMKGYLNKEHETREALKDGWFYTGDLGRFDAEGFLFITGRKKELIVTSGGKKISPCPIEDELQKDPYLLRCVLNGEGKKFITALVVPNKDALMEYAERNKIAFKDYEDLLKERVIYEFLDQRIQELMKDFASYEKIKYFALVSRDFTQEAGELTPTLKIKRDVVLARYRNVLEALYPRE